jgi:AcrR family transcriptional regulator
MSTSLSGTGSRSAYHHGDLRNALLDSASALAREDGAERLSLREVARRAGVSHAAAYNHFTDKNDLLRALAVRAFEVLGQRMRAVDAAGSLELEDMAVAYLLFAAHHGAEFRFMFQRSLCMPEGEFDPIEQASRNAQAVLREFVVKLQAEGRLAPGDPDEIALITWSLIHGMTSIFLETPAFKGMPLEAAEQIVRSQFRAVTAGLA